MELIRTHPILRVRKHVNLHFKGLRKAALTDILQKVKDSPCPPIDNADEINGAKTEQKMKETEILPLGSVITKKSTMPLWPYGEVTFLEDHRVEPVSSSVCDRSNSDAESSSVCNLSISSTGSPIFCNLGTGSSLGTPYVSDLRPLVSGSSIHSKNFNQIFRKEIDNCNEVRIMPSNRTQRHTNDRISSPQGDERKKDTNEQETASDKDGDALFYDAIDPLDFFQNSGCWSSEDEIGIPNKILASIQVLQFKTSPIKNATSVGNCPPMEAPLLQENQFPVENHPPPVKSKRRRKSNAVPANAMNRTVAMSDDSNRRKLLSQNRGQHNACRIEAFSKFYAACVKELPRETQNKVLKETQELLWKYE